MKRRRILQIAACGTLPSLSASAIAQPKPVTIVVGYAAGSSVDLVARRTAERLAPLLRRNVIVDNKAGAGGQLALSAIAGSTDGTLLAFTPAPALTLSPLTNDRLPYDPKDFIPVAATCISEAGFVVGSAHPANSFADFVLWAKTHPASIGNPGHATGPHFSAWRLAQSASIDVQHVPYRAMPQMAIEIASGQLTSGFAAMPAFVELIKGGRLKLLATAGTRRAVLFPQVPTFTELGHPKVLSGDWYGIVANARTPQSVRAEISDALKSVSRDSGYRDAIQAMGLLPEYLDTDALTVRMKEEIARWAELVKQTGFKSSS